MIQELITLIIAHIKAGLAGEFSALNSRVRSGPISDPTLSARPKWAVEARELTVSQAMGNDPAGEPGPVESRERIVVNVGTPAGPYLLASQPLAGTLSMKVVYDEGALAERSEELLPGIDFTVNIPAKSFTVLRDITGADVLRVIYRYVGISISNEFEQEFDITLYANTWTDVDKYIGIPVAIIQSRQQQIVDQFNFQNPTNYSANSFVARSMIRKIRLLRMEPLPRTSRQKLADLEFRMFFKVNGSMYLGQSLSGGFGIISDIHTPGESGSGVNIKPDLG